MSKKKGSMTMTLKDFHGGSIPSDLTLPSAPGVSPRNPDRPSAWGSSGIAGAGAGASGRMPDHHLRPRPGSSGGVSSSVASRGGSAGGGGGFDERPPAFLPHIGRHFDEDERKPLFDTSSSYSAPRRTVALDSFLPAPPHPSPPAAVSRSDLWRPIPGPGSYPPATATATAPAPQSVFPLTASNASAHPNAWATRKEVSGEPGLSGATTWSASRIAQASAVEKVSSGLWHSKPAEMEINKFPETETLDRRFRESVQVVDHGDGSHERERPRSGPSVGYAEAKERSFQRAYSDRDRDRVRDQDRVRPSIYSESNERTAASSYNEVPRPVSEEGRFGVSKQLQEGFSEPSDRPKLKLLPRTRPMESADTQFRAFEDKQVHQPPVNLTPAEDIHGNIYSPKPGSVGTDEGRAADRPKLNLKPRTQSEQPDTKNEKERQSLFGGARPRELVLKERGIDVVAHDDLASPNRARSDLSKVDLKLEHNAPSAQPGERAEIPLGQRAGRDLERKTYQSDAEKADGKRTSWRNDSWRNPREIEKPQEPPRPDPETWRKPVEQTKLDASGARLGKAASPLELAQAFSGSKSDDRSGNNLINQRNLPGQTQAPFSRLTDSRDLYAGTVHRKINGY